MKIAKLTKQDIPEVEILYKEIFQDIKNDYYGLSLKERIDLFALNPMYVARDTNNKLIGFIKGENQVQKGEIKYLGIDKNYRGLGIGTALLFKATEAFMK